MACNNIVKEIITWPIKAVICNGCCSSLSAYISALVLPFFCKGTVVPAGGGFWVLNRACGGQTQLLLTGIKAVEVQRVT